MPRGGKRDGAGGKPTWIHGKTKTIRVPEVLAVRIADLARSLDEGRIIDDVTKSKYIDLTGISVKFVDGDPVVYIDDLLKSGYTVKPITLVDRVLKRRDFKYKQNQPK